MFSKMVDVLTAPLWVPAWVGVVALRWVMGKSLEVPANFEPDPLG